MEVTTHLHAYLEDVFSISSQIESSSKSCFPSISATFYLRKALWHFSLLLSVCMWGHCSKYSYEENSNNYDFSRPYYPSC